MILFIVTYFHFLVEKLQGYIRRATAVTKVMRCQNRNEMKVSFSHEADN